MARIELSKLQEFARGVTAMIGEGPKQRTDAFVIFLSGELGSGKTAFVQSLARELGGSDAVQSPTFALMKSYRISYGNFERLVHIDAYRFEEAEEFSALLPSSFLKDPKAVVCIEWPDRVEGMLPKPDLEIHFAHIGAEEAARDIEVKGEKTR